MGSRTDNLNSHEGDVGVLGTGTSNDRAATGNIAGAHRNFIIKVEVAAIEVSRIKVLRACFKTIKLTKAKCKREKQPHGSRRLFSHTA